MKRALSTLTLFGLAIAASLVSIGALAQEGIDPMRVVYLQQAHPVLLLVADVSGSMSFPIDASQGEKHPSDYDYDSNYTWYYWKWSSSVADGYVKIYADDSISTDGEGQGCWVLGADQGKGVLRGDYNTQVYAMGNYLGWVTGTKIYISGCPNSTDNGLYKLADAPTQSGADARYWFFHVYKNTNGNNWESSYHAFAGLSPGTNYSITIEVPSGNNSQAAPSRMWLFAPPSRMAVLKNALGNSITTYSALVPTGTTSGTSNNKTYYLFAASAGPGSTSRYFDYTYGPFRAATPGMMQNPSASPDLGYTLASAPKNVVGVSSAYVDWGLMTFSAPDGCNNATTTVIQQAVADDSAQAAPLAKIMTALGPVIQGGTVKGLNARGGTPTRKALQDALTSLQGSYNLDQTACVRGFSAMLVTDGQSNCGNSNDKEWSNCPTNSGTSSNYTSYPPGVADNNWTTGINKNGATANVRTYVIGVSSDVSKCELNWTAYYGRTDASQSDVGYNTDGDPRLPPHNYDYSGVNSGHNYAFFANTAQTLIDGVQRILSTMGGGDYTTSPPIVVESLQADGAPYALLGSTEFSSLRGHLYAYDTSQAQAPVFKWDAGAVLKAQDANSRRIYTWNSTTNTLVQITDTTTTPTIAATLSTLAGLPAGTITDSIVDFILGNNGSGTPGRWRLGPILNVTPALVGAPDSWSDTQSGIPDHGTYSNAYSTRHPLIYVGSSDGMIHAFDLADGAEVFALMPPNNLANQVALYNNFINGGTDTGEPTTYANHIYGVSNSIRFADVYFTSGHGGNATASYSTCLFATEGPGGNDTSKNQTTSSAPRSSMNVINVTHPYPGRTITWPDGTTTTYNPDPNYDSANPVIRLGQIDSNSTTNLYQTWCVPAEAFYGGANPSQGLLMTSGFNPLSTVASPITPRAFVLDPSSYSNGLISISANKPLAPHSTGNIVGDQAYANAVLWAAGSDLFFNPAHSANQGVIADLSGQLWFVSNFTNNNAPAVGIDVGANQPLYYSPAVAYYNKDSTHQYNIYAFASGSFYEKSPAVTGSATCSGSGFCPTIYIAALDTIHPPALPVSPSNTSILWSKRLTDIPIDSNGHTLSDRAQVVASPVLFLSGSNVGDPFALFLIYDPGSGTCAGDSYVLQVKFTPAATNGMASTTVDSSDVFHASTGVAGGLAVTGGSVIVSVSGVGQGQRATVVKVPDIVVGQQGQGQKPLWWIELQ